MKLGFTGVYIIFLFLLKNIDCGYSLEAVLTSTHNLYFEQKYEKYQNFLSEKFPFLVVKFSVYLYRHVFVMIVFAPFWKRSLLSTHLCLASNERDIGKQCTPKSDATECGVWSGSALFAWSTGISMKHVNNKNYPDTPSTGNEQSKKWR